jgi:TPR repeat protein
MYLERGTEEFDASRAVRWLVDASDAGDDNAQLLLGSLHFVGCEIDQTFERAFELFKASANCGNDRARSIVAAMCLEGLGTKKDPAMAAEIWREQAEAGNQLARLHLAVLFELGLGVERDLSRSLDLLATLPCDQTDILEIVQTEGSSTLEQNDRYNQALRTLRAPDTGHEVAEAVCIIRSLAWQGYTPALMMLGHLYHFGLGVEHSLTTALEYYSEAVHQGYSPARHLVRHFIQMN